MPNWHSPRRRQSGSGHPGVWCDRLNWISTRLARKISPVGGSHGQHLAWQIRMIGSQRPAFNRRLWSREDDLFVPAGRAVIIIAIKGAAGEPNRAGHLWAPDGDTSVGNFF